MKQISIPKITIHMSNHVQIKGNHITKIHKQNGFLMIEVLIALIIFSICLIGLLALELNSYASTQGASSRSIATNYANDFMDKVRANKDGFINGSYTSLSAANNSCRSVSYNTINTATACTSNQMAQDDLNELINEVKNSLPQGAVVVCNDSSLAQGTPTAANCNNTAGYIAVKIFWKDKNSKFMGLNSGYSQVIVGGQL